MSVKRYTASDQYDGNDEYSGQRIDEDAEGEFVMYADYAKLEQRNAELEAALTEIHKIADSGFHQDLTELRVNIRAKARNALTKEGPR